MKYINKFFFFTIAFFTLSSAFGQSVRDLRINELYIKNNDNYTDEYGRRVPWLEIYNKAFNWVDIGGCYLTDDTTGLYAVKKNGADVPDHWYRVPKGDPKTNIPQRSFVVFYLDNQPLYGTFHVNVDPRTSSTHYIALVNSNGKDIIDIFEYPQELCDTSCSYGCISDGNRNSISYLQDFTPGSTNHATKQATKEEKLKKDDPHGIGLAIISMGGVFLMLILIYFMMKIFGTMAARRTRKATQHRLAKVFKLGKKVSKSVASSIKAPNGEEAAALAMALQLHFYSLHDEESEILTIEMPSARYSPWAQKGISMRKTPRIK